MEDNGLTRKEIMDIVVEKWKRLDEEAIASGKLKNRFFISQREEDVYNSNPLKDILEKTSFEKLKQADNTATYDVLLKAYGLEKPKVVRIVKSLGLKELTDEEDNVPMVVKESCSKEEAESIKSQLEEVGAEIEIKFRVFDW